MAFKHNTIKIYMDHSLIKISPIYITTYCINCLLIIIQITLSFKPDDKLWDFDLSHNTLKNFIHKLHLLI